MSRTKNALAGMMALFVAGSFLTCSSDTVNNSLPLTEKSINSETSTLEAVDNDQIYFDCFADMTDECTYPFIAEESSCEAHRACVDSCIYEGFGDYCFSDCDMIYLGVNSSQEDVCGCEICLQECNEWCYCNRDIIEQ